MRTPEGVDFCGGKYYYKNWRSKRWLLLLRHVFSDGFFANEQDALNSLKPYRYSILGEFANTVKMESSFEFHLEYPNNEYTHSAHRLHIHLPTRRAKAFLSV